MVYWKEGYYCSIMKYVPALDGLRAVCVTAVILAHAGIPLAGGARGVDVFFVLSGFLITSLLWDEDRRSGIDVFAFWRRRIVRLLPPLSLMVATYVLLCPFLLPDYADTRWGDAVLALTYTMNYALAYDWRTTGLDHTWSLAVEEHFYILWPLLLPWLLKQKDPVFWLVMSWAAFTVFRLVNGVFFRTPESMYYPTHVHASGLVLGAAIALKRPDAWVGWLGLGGIAAALTLDGSIMWTIPLAEISAAALISGLLCSSLLQRAFAWKPAVRMGVISYGVYLWQTPLLLVLKSYDPWLRALLALGISIMIASVSYVTVERAALRFRFKTGKPKMIELQGL